MNNLNENSFIFSSRYRLLRHIVFWLVHIVIFSFLYKLPENSYWQQHILSASWVPAFIIYSYPIMYWFIPKMLLKGKYTPFAITLLLWAGVGFFLNYFSRKYILFNISDVMHLKIGPKNPWAPAGFIVMNLMAGFGSMIVLFKYWVKKQNDWLQAEKEKVTAELQLLKAQVHPHFLFNTLNNIYSFSLNASPKTPQMILKLSSLLSYMLYECKANEVLLEKEIEIMNNYIDLEKERYANRLEVSINVEGDIKGKCIAPLLILPFLENAFKHGTSEQLEKTWLNMDISVKQKMFRCKIANSKNEELIKATGGIGIENVQKRLQYLYPGRHELKLGDEGNFFVVSLQLELNESHGVSVSAKQPMATSIV